MSKSDRTVITYKKDEVDLRDYANSKSSPSGFIKDLLKREMKREIEAGSYKEGKE